MISISNHLCPSFDKLNLLFNVKTFRMFSSIHNKEKIETNIHINPQISNITKTNKIKMCLNNTFHNRRYINFTIISSFSFLIWYFLYYKNRRIINDFIDFEIKRCISKFLTTNTAIISILSNELYNQISQQSTQDYINTLIKEKILNNKELLSLIHNKIKSELINYLSTKEGQDTFAYIFHQGIKNNKGPISEYIFDYITKESKYFHDLLESKLLQLINDEDFKKYVFNEVTKESHRVLKDKENIYYTIETLKNEFKV